MTTIGSSPVVDESRPSSTEYLAWERVDACPVCGSTDRTVVDGRASVVRCGGCSHTFVDPRPTQAEITRGYSLASAYDGWTDQASARDDLWRRRFVRMLGDVPPGRLLDVGAGLGTFLAIARDAGWSVEGTEVSSTAIDKAAERYSLSIHQGFVEDVAPPGLYDAITLWHVLEHLPEPTGTLRLCRERLADRGRLILAMPNDGDGAWALTRAGNIVRRGLGRPATRRYEPLRPGVESHIQHFDASSISDVLARCGFTVIRIGVDDASPQRTRLGRMVFAIRRGLSEITPWNVGREMLVIAERASD